MSDAAAVCGCLRERRAEIESAISLRIDAVAQSAKTLDPVYRDGLGSVLKQALDYAILAIEKGEGGAPELPTAILSQARLAARNRVGLETVLRRYLAGNTLLADFIIEAVIDCGLGKAALRQMLRTQAVLFERLVSTISEEYRRESAERLGSESQRLTEQVKRCLSGELIDKSGLGYDLTGRHIGLVATGSEAAATVRALAAMLDCRSLLVQASPDLLWAWLGLRRERNAEQLTAGIEANWPANGAMAIGEVSSALSGWRFTHRQALAAMSVGIRSEKRVVRYSDVALVCTAIRDDLLADYLQQKYVDPLDSGRRGGIALKNTLRAYLSSEQNVSCTAVVLGVSRQTVSSRLRVVEQRIGGSLRHRAGELDTALRLEELRMGPACT